MCIRYKLIIFIFFQVTSLSDPLYCPNKCGRRYKGAGRELNLNNHLTFGCEGPKKFQCSYCSKWFNHKCNLKTHSALIHKIILAI